MFSNSRKYLLGVMVELILLILVPLRAGPVGAASTIAPPFANYYDTHQGIRVLGYPLTDALTVNGYPAQYFEKGRIEDHRGENTNPDWQFMFGRLTAELVEQNIQGPVNNTSMTYADLRAATQPQLRQDPPPNFTDGVMPQDDGVFVPFDAYLRPAPGYLVPPYFWDYTNRLDLFPGGWLHDIGLPMTRPYSVKTTKNGVARTIITQAFERSVLTYDPLNPVEWQVERGNIGSDTVKFLNLGEAGNINLPAAKKILIIVLENADYSQAMAQPYLKKLAGQGALLTDYSGVGHPSYPNYLALIAGSTFGIKDDNQVNLDQTTLMDLMENRGVSWKFYAEQYPAGKCFTGDQSGNYVRRHLPILSFVKFQKDAALCSKVVPATQLAQDLAGKNQPDYSFYVPDLKNDGHDTSVTYAANWLEGFLNNLATNSEFVSQTLIIVTFDESESYKNNQIYTVLIGPTVKPGSASGVQYNHYNLLRTIEDNFNLGNLGREDTRATPITGIWQTIN